MTKTVTDLRQVRAQPANEFERWMICNSCGERWLVCGAVSDLVDGAYRCFRCRWPASLWSSRFVKPRGVEA